MAYGVELDAPVMDLNVGIHHPRFGLALPEKMDALGMTCEVVKTLRE